MLRAHAPGDRHGFRSRAVGTDAPEPEPVIEEGVAYLVTDALREALVRGTGQAVSQAGFRAPAAGKTGTTNDGADAWFVGYTPDIVAGVWVGFDQPRTILPRGFASDVAVPMWAAFMKAATQGDKPEWFSPPKDITTATVCRLSGKLATEGCERVEVVGGHQPTGGVSRVEIDHRQQPAAGARDHPCADVRGRVHGVDVGRAQSGADPAVVEGGVARSAPHGDAARGVCDPAGR